MPRRRGAALRGIGGLLLVCLLCVIPGCGATSRLEDAGIDLTLPAGWQSADAADTLVPGTLLGAWRGPDGASLAVYQTLPIPGGDPKALEIELNDRLGSLPECRTVAGEVTEVGGAKAARIEMVGPGVGSALASSGLGVPQTPKGQTLAPTRRVCIGVPREADTVWVECHFPEQVKDRLAPALDGILKSLRIQSRKSSYSSYQ